MLAESLAPHPIHGLSELFRCFDSYRERIPLDVLASALRRLDLTQEDLSGFSIFDSDCYKRNQLRLGSAYEALLICWKAGQRSPIHDHVGSSCAFRVLQGECTEIVYQGCCAKDARKVRSISSSAEGEGFVCATQDDDIHEVANLGSGNLQTLHIYSPPLAAMGTYVADGVDTPSVVPNGAFVSNELGLQ